MSPQKLDESSSAFMLAQYQEVHEYLRDTSRRMASQVQFFLTMGTALVAGFFVVMSAKVDQESLHLAITLICIALAGQGFITVVRLSSIKVQATIHFARAYRTIQYFLDKDPQLVQYFAGEGMLQDSDIRLRHFPFTQEIVFLLRAFAMFNGAVMTLGLVFGAATILEASAWLAWYPSVSYVAGYGTLAVFGFVAVATLSNRYLNAQINRARVDFSEILPEPRRAEPSNDDTRGVGTVA